MEVNFFSFLNVYVKFLPCTLKIDKDSLPNSQEADSRALITG